MPVPVMALLALMVFGAMEALPATAAILELPVHARAAERNAAHPCDNFHGHRNDLGRWQPLGQKPC